MECNTELCLSPCGYDQFSYRAEEEIKPLTILYEGQICTCDATEIQARAIIFKAKQAIETSCENHKEDEIEMESENRDKIIPIRTNSGLSMKRSLQRFLLQRRIMKLRDKSKDNNSFN